jgi:hypothetical protein
LTAPAVPPGLPPILDDGRAIAHIFYLDNAKTLVSHRLERLV